ncbi:50S ribosomal protein L16 [Candidatus Dojkabacteria bacterium]|uniref:50S ribosomal protein L16 n=1 Tax=Candidatus Dojkabacteria bacterium TaxID=2099670 RepID=A0A3M0YY85_9BACT|nr:MAG: 50S ribosomal protein L16 [Candidatus Dojkabacteria bacterium]
MLQPSKRKYTKEFRGRVKGFASKGCSIVLGEYGLKAITGGWISSRQLESARKAINNYTKRKSKLWIKVFPHKPVTKKSDEQVRGGGKGPVDHYVAVVKPGVILFEISGVSDEVAIEALERGAHKLGIKTVIVKR